MRTKLTHIATLLGCAVAFSAASAAPLAFKADLTPLNNSGVSGFSTIVVDGGLMTVRVRANGLVPDQPHAQHIHGRFDSNGAPIDSQTPTFADDADNDGFVEVLEGVPRYGDVLLSLSQPPAETPGAINFPTAPNGRIDFTETYDLSNDSLFFSPVTGAQYTGADLMPLDLREIVIHGLIAPQGDGVGTPDGEAGDGPLAYIGVLPAAAGEFSAVPLPAPALMLTSGLALIGFASLRRRRRTAG